MTICVLASTHSREGSPRKLLPHPELLLERPAPSPRGSTFLCPVHIRTFIKNASEPSAFVHSYICHFTCLFPFSCIPLSTFVHFSRPRLSPRAQSVIPCAARLGRVSSVESSNTHLSYLYLLRPTTPRLAQRAAMAARVASGSREPGPRGPAGLSRNPGAPRGMMSRRTVPQSM